MSERTCQSCDEPVRDVMICRRCENQTRHHLTDQEAHRQQLIVALTRMTRMQAPNSKIRATDPASSWAALGPMHIVEEDDKHGIPIPTVWDEIAKNPIAVPYARAAAGALHSQRSLLVAWCRDLAETHDVPLPPNTIATMSIHLHDHMRILRKHPAGGEFVHELRALVSQIMRVIDLPAFRRFVVGLCPVVHPGHDGPEECPGQVHAILPSDEQVPAVISCPVCFTRWESHEWTRAGALILRRSERKAS